MIVLYVPCCSHNKRKGAVLPRTARREVRTVSISMTVLKPFSDSLEIGARKFPAAPIRARKNRSGYAAEWKEDGAYRR